MASDPLHFPRHELAGHIISMFHNGLASAVTLFAPRRKGKTQFLLFDLLPMARDEGYLVAYGDLWSQKDSPEVVLAQALTEALGEADTLQKLRGWWQAGRKQSRRRVGKVELGLGAEGVKAGAEIASDSLMISEIEALFSRFVAAGNGKAILVLDEIQHLGTRPGFETFTAALRSMMDRNRGNVFGVFTGSSQGGLTAMFQRTKAPFYLFSQSLEFKDLGAEFVHHFAQHYHRITQKHWQEAEALKLFRARGNTPAYLRALIRRCIEAGESPAEADKVVWQDMVDQVGYEEIVRSLDTLQREVLLRVLQGQPLYAEEALKAISKTVGTEVKTHQVQGALRRLESLNITGRVGRGEPIIEDDLLKAWLSERF